MASSRLTDAQLPEYIMIRIKSVRNNTDLPGLSSLRQCKTLFFNLNVENFARWSFFRTKSPIDSRYKILYLKSLEKSRFGKLG